MAAASSYTNTPSPPPSHSSPHHIPAPSIPRKLSRRRSSPGEAWGEEGDMADKENSIRLTRAAAKRATGQPLPSDQPPSKRKRVALSELPTLSNVAPHRLDQQTQPSKPRTRSKKKAVVQKKTPPEDSIPIISTVDSNECGDVQLCADYAPDIYQYLRSMEVETKRRPLAKYIETVQTDVTVNMRGILVDWLVEVAEEYKVVADTLFLTISYIDRFLSANAITRHKLQLLGVSSMLIASKYEEITPPHVEDFVFITDNTYNKQEVVKMESDILKFLNFEMGNPTIKTFLRRFIRVGEENEKHPALQLEFLGSYLAELSLIDYDCIGFLPSLVAASAVFVARFTIDPHNHPWTATLHKYTGYRSSELKECILLIHDLQLNRRGSNLVAVREKYKEHKFKCVSKLISPTDIPTSYFEDITQ